MREIRIAAWPFAGQTNAYIDLFYRALEPLGVRLVRGLRFDDAFLREQGRGLDAIHIHWCPEQIWRTRGRTTAGQLHGVIGWWRYVRLAKRMGIKVLWTVHDLERPEGGGLVDWCGDQVLASAADLRICHSECCRTALVARYGADRPTLAIPFGTYEDVLPAPRPRHETLARLGLRDDARTLVCQGVVRPYKGFDLAIEAARQLGSNYQLIIAGDSLNPAVGRELQSRAAHLSHVRLILGRLDDQAVADVLHAADCVVFPYRWITGSSALMAAFTMGRGVVTSDLPFFREVLSPEPDAGVRCAPGDATALARAIDTFFTNDPDRRDAAVRRLAARSAWSEVVRPVAEWLAHEFPATAAAARAPLTTAPALEGRS